MSVGKSPETRRKKVSRESRADHRNGEQSCQLPSSAGAEPANFREWRKLLASSLGALTLAVPGLRIIGCGYRLNLAILINVLGAGK
jgi:hypothetical protein